MHFAHLCLLLLTLMAPPALLAGTRSAVALDARGQALRLDGNVVLVAPDIELMEITAGGLREPRQAWSEAAREHFESGVRRAFAGSERLLPAALAPEPAPAADSRLGQVLRLHEVVALSIAQSSQPGSVLATKRNTDGSWKLDWSLGPGVAELRAATGADYALFTYVRDSYASGGRTALRVLGFLAGAAMGSVMDIGGGQQVGVVTLVDLRDGRVVWFNLLARQSGDLREADDAARSVELLLTNLPK